MSNGFPIAQKKYLPDGTIDRIIGGRGDDWTYDIYGSRISHLYAYMKRGKRYITRDGYAQIVGGWLELDSYSTKQRIVIDKAREYLQETDELKIWSRRGGFTIYASPIDNHIVEANYESEVDNPYHKKKKPIE